MDCDFSEILREFLTINNMTQTEFAKRVGVKQSQVSEWLKGKAKPSYDILRQMSLSLGVSSDYLLGLDDDFRK